MIVKDDLIHGENRNREANHLYRKPTCRMLIPFLALFAACVSGLNTGVSGALTQNFMNYLIQQGLPVGLDFLRKYPLPNPIASGDDDSISWKVEDGQIITVDAAGKIALNAPNVLQLSIFNLNLDLKAKVNAREDVWPHPSVSADAEAKCNGATATASLASVLVNGVPQVSVAACSLDIDISVTISGLGPFDELADLIVKAFKGKIEDIIRTEVCDELITTVLVANFLNPFLQKFKYQFPLPIPAPFDQAILDFHITQTPDVYNGYLRMAATGEVYSADGRHDPDPVAPLPDVSPSVWGSKMVSFEVGAFPFDSTVWTFFTQKLLTYTATKSDVPSSLAPVLNTAFYKTLMPKLYAAFPDADMQVVIFAATQPHFQMMDGHIEASCNMSYAFEVAGATPAPAFLLWSPFEVTLHVSVKGNAIVGGLDNATVTLYAGNCPYGDLGPDILAALSVPVNGILNALLIPLLNAFVAKGVQLPSFEEPLGQVAIVYGNFVNPVIALNAGYLLIATDANITIVAKTTGLPFPA